MQRAAFPLEFFSLTSQLINNERLVSDFSNLPQTYFLHTKLNFLLWPLSDKLPNFGRLNISRKVDKIGQKP